MDLIGKSSPDVGCHGHVEHGTCGVFPVRSFLRVFLALLVVIDFVNRFDARWSSFDAGNAAAGLAAGVFRIHSFSAAEIHQGAQTQVWHVVRVRGQSIFIWIVETLYYFRVCIHAAKFAIEAVCNVAGEVHYQVAMDLTGEPCKTRGQKRQENYILQNSLYLIRTTKRTIIVLI